MLVLETGESVFQLRFLPDGRLLVGLVALPEKTVSFHILTVPGGDRVRLDLPSLNVESWWYSGHSNAVAIDPSGDRCCIAWSGRLFACRTSDGTPLPVPEAVKAHQVVLSPNGDRLLAIDLSSGSKQLFALKADADGIAVIRRKALSDQFRHVAGFLPDGERFVTIDDSVRIHTFDTDEELAATRYPTYNVNQPQLSPDGRHLGVIGYASMYLFDISALGKPRRITGTRSCGDFVSFAFHPGGHSLAVIHGGPTLVKVYDLESLRRVRTFNWKLGPLGCVAYSPDGMLGAAGSQGGRIVLWDVDE